jgi:hypothetical protein
LLISANAGKFLMKKKLYVSESIMVKGEEAALLCPNRHILIRIICGEAQRQ